MKIAFRFISHRLLLAVRILACLAIGAVALCIHGFLGTSNAHAQATLPVPSHVVIVLEENRSFSEIIGSSNAPYLNALANTGAVFTSSFAITHPSEPNYQALFSGSTQGLTDDSCPHTFSPPDLGGALIQAGFSFGGYAESLPSVGSTVCTSGEYARKHAPWVNFPDVSSSANMPFTSFPTTNFNALPTVSFVIPNLLDDMHDGTIQQADNWLQQHIDSYVQWAKANNSLLIVTWDEDDSSQANQIPTLFVGPMVRPGQYAEQINHYNVLRTLEDMYGLPAANNSANASAITDCWQVASGIFTTSFESGQPQPTWTDAVDSAGHPAGGLSNVGDICCSLSGPEMGVRDETAHTGGAALMYSGKDNSATTSYAYMKIFDLSTQNLTVGPTTALTYWVYPENASSSAPGANLTSGNNSSCVAIDLIFGDSTNLRDSGATDQHGNRVHPAYQCSHFTMNAWNQVVVNLGAFVSGKTIVRLDVGYDQPANTGGYRGYIDDISIGASSQFNNAGISDDSNQGTANIDGHGFSYSAQALAASNFTPGATVTVGGITYTWPNIASGLNDNVMTNGQTIPISGAVQGATQLTFLGSATNGPSTGTITIIYTDGTSQVATLGLSDWTLNGGSATASYGNVVAYQMSYRNSTSGTSQQITTYVFASAPISLNASKQVAGIVLPASVNQGHLHIFAWTVSA